MDYKISWPENKNFAFTIFDDTDLATLENTPPVYDFLYDLGFLTTKSVWPVRGKRNPLIGGSTCEDNDYLKWVIELGEKGFEICMHNVTYHTSPREYTIYGIEKFKQLFGHYPYSCANHAGCGESIYWGDSRLTGLNKMIYNLLLRFRHHNKFKGHIEGDPLFWGDICHEKIKYVRDFVFGEINTLKVCPIMPYHDKNRPYVNCWFSSSEGPNVQSFNKMISVANQDKLEEENGACIMYTHFANGFSEYGKINYKFRELMNKLSKRNGWFVPVSTMLDYLVKIKGIHNISKTERINLERKWILHKIRIGGSS